MTIRAESQAMSGGQQAGSEGPAPVAFSSPLAARTDAVVPSRASAVSRYVAVSAGGLVLFGVGILTGFRLGRPGSFSGEPAPLVVAARAPLPPGCLILPDDLMLRPAKQGDTSGSARTIDEVVGRIPDRRLEAGTIVPLSGLRAEPEEGVRIPGGYRTVSLSLPPAALPRVGLSPGAKVHLFGSFSSAGDPVVLSLSDAILVSVRPDSDRVSGATRCLATFAVPVANAARLILAGAAGQVRAISSPAEANQRLSLRDLRGPRGQVPLPTARGQAPAVRVRALGASPAVTLRIVPPPVPAVTANQPAEKSAEGSDESGKAGPPAETVTVIRGSEVEEVPLEAAPGEVARHADGKKPAGRPPVPSTKGEKESSGD